MEGEARKALPGLYKKYGITDKPKIPPKPKKKKGWLQTWMQGFLDRFKRKKKKRSVPKIHPKDRPVLDEIMRSRKKRKQTTVSGVRG